MDGDNNYIYYEYRSGFIRVIFKTNQLCAFLSI